VTVPRWCLRCCVKPVATPRHAHCFGCLPGGPRVPPPCRKCGSAEDYYSGGLCRRCHRFAPQVVDSCVDCLGWGVTRRTGFMCEACRGWRRKVAKAEGRCVTCKDWSALNSEGLCRLCRRQAALIRTFRPHVTAAEANRHGQQLFIAGTFRQRRPRPAPARSRAGLPAGYPAAHRQLVLFDAARDPAHVHAGRLPGPRDPALETALLQAAGEHAARYGWSRTRKVDARSAIRILLALQDTPGAPIKASAVTALAERFAAQPVLDILTGIGMLEDDREPSVTGWFDDKIAGLPEPMASELRTWLEVMRDGSTTPPRRLPRSHTTIRLQLRFALPTLKAWAAAGRTSLREISRDDVLAALPAEGTPRSTTGQGLRSIFTILKGRKIIFTNPMTRVRTGRPEDREPLPLSEPGELGKLRQALNCDNPARAAMAALAAFHGLRSHHLRALLLTDIDGARLHAGDRTVLLAAPARQRLTAWLDHRTARWPQTLNAHLFINVYTAVRTGPVSNVYINKTAGMPVRRIREDRILHEAHASGGDVRRLCDLFGLSIKGAERYTSAPGRPGLAT
jgi:integrase